VKTITNAILMTVDGISQNIQDLDPFVQIWLII